MAEVHVGDQQGELSAGGVAVVPEGLLHHVRNTGAVTLRFVAVYARQCRLLFQKRMEKTTRLRSIAPP